MVTIIPTFINVKNVKINLKSKISDIYSSEMLKIQTTAVPFHLRPIFILFALKLLT